MLLPSPYDANKPEPTPIVPLPVDGEDDEEESELQQPPVPTLPRINPQSRRPPVLDRDKAKLYQALSIGGLATSALGALAGSPEVAQFGGQFNQQVAQGYERQRREHQARQEAFRDWLQQSHDYNREQTTREQQMRYSRAVDDYEYRRGRQDEVEDDQREFEQTIKELERRNQLSLEAKKGYEKWKRNQPLTPKEKAELNRVHAQTRATNALADQRNDGTSLRNDEAAQSLQEEITELDRQIRALEGIEDSLEPEQQMRLNYARQRKRVLEEDLAGMRQQGSPGQQGQQHYFPGPQGRQQGGGFDASVVANQWRSLGAGPGEAVDMAVQKYESGELSRAEANQIMDEIERIYGSSTQ